MPLKLMYITNDLQVALIAEKYGVDRIWIDLETIGKEERQYGKDTVISHHTVEDIARIKPHLSKSEMLVRINPWYDGSREEIDDVGCSRAHAPRQGKASRGGRSDHRLRPRAS